MSDPTGPSTPESRPGPGAEPVAESAAPPTAPTPAWTPAPAPPPSDAPSALSGASPLPAWSSLDQDTRMVAAGGVGAAIVLLIGGLIGAWPSTEFLLIALIAAVVAAGAAWLQSMVEDATASLSIPAPIVGLIAGAVLAVLAVWNVIEMIFDLDQLDERGGALGALATIALAVAAVALLIGAVRRAPAVTIAVRSTDLPTRLVVAGYVLVLIAWAVNLASYWTMNQATRSLWVLTLAAAITLLASRGLPVLSAWVGVAFGAIGALIALDHWNQLVNLGDDTSLGVTDFLPLLIYSIGIALIIAAGVLIGLAARAVTAPPPTAPENQAS